MNKEYDNVLQSSLSVFNATSSAEWEQFYLGLVRGLGSVSKNIMECVEDGNRTVETFRLAFSAFENREIVAGKYC